MPLSSPDLKGPKVPLRQIGGISSPFEINSEVSSDPGFSHSESQAERIEQQITHVNVALAALDLSGHVTPCRAVAADAATLSSLCKGAQPQIMHKVSQFCGPPIQSLGKTLPKVEELRSQLKLAIVREGASVLGHSGATAAARHSNTTPNVTQGALVGKALWGLGLPEFARVLQLLDICAQHKAPRAIQPCSPPPVSQ